MFVKAIKDNKKGRDGYYCSLVESVRTENGPSHKLIRSFGYIERERVPYLKAAFNDGDPASILEQELARMEERQ